MNVICLPATDPRDERYGTVPNQIAGYPDAAIRQVRFPTVVWYNEAVRREAKAQILGWGLSDVTLVGFSKSGLGAWNIAREIPDRVGATIIFDAPASRDHLPPWGTAPFYADDEAWQADLPLRTVESFAATASRTHRLVLIPGDGFRDEMRTLSRALAAAGHDHVYLDIGPIAHHWNSGWLEVGLRAAYHGNASRHETARPIPRQRST